MKPGPNTKGNKDISFMINLLFSSKKLKKFLLKLDFFLSQNFTNLWGEWRGLAEEAEEWVSYSWLVLVASVLYR